MRLVFFTWESIYHVRLIERLMMQVEHVLVSNQIQVVMKEVVETTGQNFIIGRD